MGTLLYFIREGIRGFYHAKVMTLVSIMTIAVAILFAACIAVGLINIQKLFMSAAEESDVVAYVKDRTSSDTAAMAMLCASIRSLPQVHRAAVVDKETAWERFSAVYGSEMLKAVDENPFPVAVEITLENGSQTPAAADLLTKRLETLDGVDGVRYAREWMVFLKRIERYFQSAALVLGCILLVMLYVTIFNTVRLTIYARRELVRNMHLVGATRFFISMPFIIEGMIQGVVGGAAGIAVFYLVKAIFLYEPTLRTIPLSWGPPSLPAAFILLGVVFGWTGSFFAVRKFLA